MNLQKKAAFLFFIKKSKETSVFDILFFQRKCLVRKTQKSKKEHILFSIFRAKIENSCLEILKIEKEAGESCLLFLQDLSFYFSKMFLKGEFQCAKMQYFAGILASLKTLERKSLKYPFLPKPF